MRVQTQLIEMYQPSVLHFGEGALSKLTAWVDERGFSKPFVVADTVNARRISSLGLKNVAVFGTVKPEPDVPNLMSAVAEAEVAGADLVIGFGGGSAMDLAKLVAVMIGQGVSLQDISGPNRAPQRRVGLVQIPTTSGTGSEAGTRALITDPETHNKIATESPYMLADMTIIDPVLTQSVPPMVTAATGIDALAHCVEAFTSKRAHPLIDGYAVQGIELVGSYLKRAVRDGNDIEARAGLALAAYYGGICLGPVNTTAGHAVAYPLSTRYGIPHGLANALIFPHTLAANAPAVWEKTQIICRALGFSVATPTPDEVRAGARGFCEDLGLAMDLRSHDVRKESLSAMAAEASGIRRLLDWNPVDLSPNNIEELYLAAW
ncbi:MAG: iron-containing alcohol dehydrogenase [Candidatus Competibacteraceae bacterium]|nr:iron-containing alcohol dehydrogenase [Candidatus Competibacteraceae bacterium]